MQRDGCDSKMMNDNMFLNKLEAHPIIAAVRTEEGIEKALSSSVKVIILLNGSLSNIRPRIKQIKSHGKLVFVHIEMISGLSKDQAAVEFLKMELNPTGIVTTKPNLVQKAKKLGLCTIQRLFMLDSLSIQTGIKMINSNPPDLVEIMPGIIPKVILQMKNECNTPIIAGGMIKTKEEIIELLGVGARAVSTSKTELWNL